MRINIQDPKYAYVLIIAGAVLYYFSLIKANPLAFYMRKTFMRNAYVAP